MLPFTSKISNTLEANKSIDLPFKAIDWFLYDGNFDVGQLVQNDLNLEIAEKKTKLIFIVE